jgi:hypothetical protein
VIHRGASVAAGAGACAAAPDLSRTRSLRRANVRFEKQKSAVEIKNRHVLGAETERVVAKKSKSNVSRTHSHLQQ